jgi:PAS domain S-box-containing protein
MQANRWVIELAAGLTALGVLIKVVVLPVGRFMVSVKKNTDLLAQVAEELKPNGGGSLRDAVDRIDNRSARSDAFQRAAWSFWDESGLYEADTEGRCVWVNRAYRRISQRETEELLGQGWIVAIAPGDRDAVLREWEHCIADERDFTMDYKMVNAHGELIAVKGMAVPLRDDDGTVIGWLGRVLPLVRRQSDIEEVNA